MSVMALGWETHRARDLDRLDNSTLAGIIKGILGGVWWVRNSRKTELMSSLTWILAGAPWQSPQHHPWLSHLYQEESIKTSIFSEFQIQMLWGAVDMCIPETQQALRQGTAISCLVGVCCILFFSPSMITLYTLEFSSPQSSIPCSSWIALMKVMVAAMEPLVKSIHQVLHKFHLCIYTP